MNENLSPSLERSIAKVRELFGGSDDLNIVRFETAGIKCAVLTLEGMTSSADLSKMLFSPLMDFKKILAQPQDVYSFLMRKGIFSTESKHVRTYSDVSERLCSGFAVVLIDGEKRGVAFGAQGFKTRSISEPSTENNLKGCMEAFSDNLKTSMSLVRRRIKSPLLRFETMKAGKISQTELAIAYISGKAPERLVNEVKSRLRKIRLDIISGTGCLEPFLSPNPGSFFSGCSTTERPDVLAAKINEGRIAVLIDGVPFAVVCPALFMENFQAVDDYEEKPYFAFLQRLLRYLSFLAAGFLPGFYLAATIHHPEILAKTIMTNLITSEEDTPFPLMLEMVIVVVLFEIMREAGLRLPKAVGGAVSIVGGLVIGDAAVTSGLISSPLLIIIGITATCSFVLPSLNPQLTALRFIGIFAGGLWGFFGMAVFSLVILVNAAAGDCLSVPYLSPAAPFTMKATRDLLWRVGYRKMQKNRVTVESLNGSGRES
ncbi:MAG: spore germination protein [Oscillospiraceae bacterium]|nr:spore germination protein [Oscillospiraceae bacterium]